MADETKVIAPATAVTAPDPATALTSGQLAVVPAGPPPPPPPVTPQPAKVSWWIWAGLAAIIIAAAALWYFQPWVTKGLAVTGEVVTPAPLVRVLAVNGRIAPLHLVQVKSTVAAEVLNVLVAEGDVVKPGDVLARMDASAQQAMVRQAMAGLDAGLVAEAQAMASLKRAEALGGNIARTALDDARTASQTAAQEVARLQALFDQARISLEKYTVTAPIAGTILTRDAEAGQGVDPTATLFSMADLKQLVVETDVDESYAARMAIGLPAVLQLKGGTEKLDGSVSFLAAQVDAATGGLAVKIGFTDPVAAPVGLTVTANIIVDSQNAAIAVPRAAVMTDTTGAAVFLAVAGKAMRRAVTVVDWPADRLEITAGLQAGDVVIVDAAGLSDGAAITLAPPAPLAP